MKRLFLFGAIALMLCACTGNGVKNPVTLSLSPQQKQLTEKCNDFSFSLLREVYSQEAQSENVVVSPLSASMMLGMVMNGAKGQTLEEMQSVLDFDDEPMSEINEYYKTLLDALPALDKSNKVRMANAIWIDENYPVKQEFKDVNKKYFYATIDNVDFADSKTLDRINKWASDNTEKLIKKVVTPDDVDADTRLILANALYFKGLWKEKFSKNATKSENFTTSKGDKLKADRMNLNEKFMYADLEYGKVLEMNYKEYKYCMDILLPNKGLSIAEVLTTLDFESWGECLRKMQMYEVKVGLPKFSVSYNTELPQALKAMGMPTAFNPVMADFSLISEASHLYLSQVKQFCYMNVDEEGTEAAAVTWGSMKDAAEPLLDHKEFIADRPFILLIREKQYGTILFMAVIGNPTA